jgi:hypothetical protein
VLQIFSDEPYVLPVQAKGGKDQINIVQIEQDLAMCAGKFPKLQSRPIPAEQIDAEEIKGYQSRME